jgi:hypothetical protein
LTIAGAKPVASDFLNCAKFPLNVLCTVWVVASVIFIIPAYVGFGSIKTGGFT